MIANAGKFKAILIRKDGAHTENTPLIINSKEIASAAEVTLIGLQIDNKLNFNSYISKLCRKAANHLNALKRFRKYINNKDKKLLTNTYVLSQFNYCPIVWHFCGKGGIHMIEKIHERAIRFVTNDYTSEYLELLNKENDCTLYLRRVRLIAQEVYKSIHGLNPGYIKELLQNRRSNYPTRTPLNLYIPKVNQIKFGYRSYTFEAPSIWNSLPLEIRKASNFPMFKKLIKTWEGPSCRCNLCAYNDTEEV